MNSQVSGMWDDFTGSITGNGTDDISEKVDDNHEKRKAFKNALKQYDVRKPIKSDPEPVATA